MAAFGYHSSLCPMSTTFERSQKGYLKTEAATVIYWVILIPCVSIVAIQEMAWYWDMPFMSICRSTLTHDRYYKNMYYIPDKDIVTVEGIWRWEYVDTSIRTVNIWLHSINEDRMMCHSICTSHHRRRMMIPQRDGPGTCIITCDNESYFLIYFLNIFWP